MIKQEVLQLQCCAVVRSEVHKTCGGFQANKGEKTANFLYACNEFNALTSFIVAKYAQYLSIVACTVGGSENKTDKYDNTDSENRLVRKIFFKHFLLILALDEVFIPRCPNNFQRDSSFETEQQNSSNTL